MNQTTDEWWSSVSWPTRLCRDETTDRGEASRRCWSLPADEAAGQLRSCRRSTWSWPTDATTNRTWRNGPLGFSMLPVGFSLVLSRFLLLFFFLSKCSHLWGFDFEVVVRTSASVVLSLDLEPDSKYSNSIEFVQDMVLRRSSAKCQRMYETMFSTVTHYYVCIAIYALWWSSNAVLRFKLFASCTMHVLITFRTDL
jgi:hypothetical protein